MNSTDKVRSSRRERPAKPALTRQGVIDAALEILRTNDLGKVTMRRIAASLDTGPASLYVYVRDTEDLHAQVLDALLARLTGEGEAAITGDWHADLKELIRRYMVLLFSYPALARMAMSTPASGPHYMALVERILDLLRRGGVPDRNAAWGVDLLLLYATANAAEHCAWRASERGARNMSALADAVTAARPDVYPNIARLGPDLMSGKGARFEWSLDLLIDGIVQARSPALYKELEL